MQPTASSDLEARLRIVEDKLAIYELIASHPPSADTGHADYTRSVYQPDGVFDRGPTLDGAQGAKDIAAFILRPEHEAAIRGGLAHFAGLPLIDLRGDSAIVTSYLMIVHLDDQGPARELPNHGVSTGYRIHRAVVNRWELERQDQRWTIARRTLLPVNGADIQRELLRSGLDGLHFHDLLSATAASSADGKQR
ncbi:nuclear transport factor 2 family protein [Pseudomonas sp. SDO524_S393]